MADHETDYYEQEDLWGRSAHSSDAAAMVDAVTAMVPDDVGSVLDVGCGDGIISIHLADARSVVAGDRSMAALRHVEVPAVQLTGDALPFPDDSIDLVMCTDVLEHLDDDIEQRVLDELIRVSRRHVLVAVPHQEPLSHFRVRCGSCSSVFHAHHHQRSYGIERFAALAASAVLDWRLVGARWACLDPAVSELALSLGGAGYPFSLAVCPQCGHRQAAGQADDEGHARSRRRFESVQYLLGETGRRPWPPPSELVVLLSVENASGDIPAARNDETAPPALPFGKLRPEPQRRRETLESFPREWSWVEEPGRVTFVLPTRPTTLAVSGASPQGVFAYDHVAQRYEPLSSVGDDPARYLMPEVAPDLCGYRLAIDLDDATELAIEVAGGDARGRDALAPFGVDRDLSAALASAGVADREIVRLAQRADAATSHGNDIERARAETEARLVEAIEHANAIEAQRSTTEEKLVEQQEISETLAQRCTSLSDQVTELTVRTEQLRAELSRSISIASLPRVVRRWLTK